MLAATQSSAPHFAVREPASMLLTETRAHLLRAEMHFQEAFAGCDTYRALHPQGQDYTWWSNRGAARANNVGWRIDYQFATPSLRPKRCAIAATPRFSDHAPYLVEYAPIK